MFVDLSNRIRTRLSFIDFYVNNMTKGIGKELCLMYAYPYRMMGSDTHDTCGGNE